MAVTAYETNEPGRTCKRCSDPAKEDSDFCAFHHERQKEYMRRSMAKKRKAWAKAKRCNRCGRKRRPGHPWGCARCLLMLGRLRSGAVKTDVKQTRDRIVARTEAVTEGDGRTRARYRGKSTAADMKRGRLSRAEIDLQDIDLALKALHQSRDDLVKAYGPEVAQLPPIQRREYVDAAVALASLAARHIGELTDRNARK